MIRRSLIHISLLSFVLFYSCSETSTSPEEPAADPNGEEELLLAFGADEAPGKVKVIARNIYVGTDVTSIFGAGNISEIPSAVRDAFYLLENTSFTERAEALVDEIEKTRPHLIGLQEVAHVFIQSPGDILSGNPQPAESELYDYLQIFVDALAARGLNYSVAAVLSNADIELPMLPTSHSNPGSLLDDVRLIDRDAVLVRSDVSYSNVAEVHYSDSLIIDASLGIVVPRGYAAVTADINGQSIRFATTHLESFDPSLVLRNGQLNQLLAEMENENVPVILAGDFNFSPDSFLYDRIIQNGYEDAWTNNTLTYNPDGLTYGHDDDLRNTSVDFRTRIDYVFVKSSNSFLFEESFVVGDELRDRTPSNLWPSDHAGVVSKINFNQ